MEFKRLYCGNCGKQGDINTIIHCQCPKAEPKWIDRKEHLEFGVGGKVKLVKAV